MKAALPEGTVFAGRYRIVRCLATGGMGAVYEAVHLETDRHRALKVMHPHIFQSDEMRERFKREARIAAHVESEHIVDVSDAGVDEATMMPFLVMELLRGEDLSHRIKRTGPLPPEETLTYLHQTALALDKTHALAIVHRDLKPENIFLTQRDDGSPRIKVLDFGIAKLVRDATAAGATQSLGTPTYMAPEQFRAGSKLSPAADIYALGMMAYTLLVGKAYWSQELQHAGDVIAFVLVAMLGPQQPATWRAAIRGVALPLSFDPWFAKATAVDPAQRFQRASEAVLALREALASATDVETAAPGSAAAIAPPGPPVALRPVQESRPGTIGLEGSTATSAALTLVQPRRSRRPVATAAAALGLAALGASAWLGLQPGSSSPVVAASPAHGGTSAAAETAGASASATGAPSPSIVPSAAVMVAQPAPSAETALPAPFASASALVSERGTPRKPGPGPRSPPSAPPRAPPAIEAPRAPAPAASTATKPLAAPGTLVGQD
jgi:serine/threonine-protein kinase